MEEQGGSQGLSAKPADEASVHGGQEHVDRNAQILPSPLRKEGTKSGGGFLIEILYLFYDLGELCIADPFLDARAN